LIGKSNCLSYFFTGFPGFIATNMIKHLAARHERAQFKLPVHPGQLDKAEKEIGRLLRGGLSQREQFELLPGDITQKHMGLHESVLTRLEDTVTHVFHLAAVYDLAVPKDLAYKVNVIDTSTAYVSGERKGRVLEHRYDPEKMIPVR
jgi:thioester reductase-like protein